MSLPGQGSILSQYSVCVCVCVFYTVSQVLVSVCSGQTWAQRTEGLALGHVWRQEYAAVPIPGPWQLWLHVGRGLLPCWSVQGSFLPALPGLCAGKHQP